MIQRITLINGIRDEIHQIEYFNTLISLTNNAEEKQSLKYFLSEKLKHKKYLENMLEKYSKRKGQTQITKMLQME